MPVKLEDQDRDPSRKYQDLLLWLMYVLFHSFSPYLIPYLRTFAPLEKWPTFTGLLVSKYVLKEADNPIGSTSHCCASPEKMINLKHCGG